MMAIRWPWARKKKGVRRRIGRTALIAANKEWERANAQLARCLQTLDDFTSAEGRRRLGVNGKTIAEAHHDLDVATTKGQEASYALTMARVHFWHCKTCNCEGEVDVNERMVICPSCNGASR